ncbi:MAG: enoyl-CoA hydratase/isomerase family protein [Anaerolineales bacterium]
MRDGVATMTLNRPEKLNAITDKMRGELLKYVERCDADPDVRVIVLTGEGRAFCTGGDIEYLRELKERNDEQEFVRLLDEGSRIVRTLRQSEKPTIAMVNGPAFGGGLILAMACDFRYCAASAKFGMPFININLGPDWGGTYLLSHIVGSALALDMLAAGKEMTPTEALTRGLVSRVYADENLETAVTEIATELAMQPHELLTRYKRSVYHSLAHSFDEAASLERQYQLENFRSNALTVGLDTFLNRKS